MGASAWSGERVQAPSARAEHLPRRSWSRCRSQRPGRARPPPVWRTADEAVAWPAPRPGPAVAAAPRGRGHGVGGRSGRRCPGGRSRRPVADHPAHRDACGRRCPRATTPHTDPAGRRRRHGLPPEGALPAHGDRERVVLLDGRDLVDEPVTHAVPSLGDGGREGGPQATDVGRRDAGRRAGRPGPPTQSARPPHVVWLATSSTTRPIHAEERAG